MRDRANRPSLRPPRAAGRFALLALALLLLGCLLAPAAGATLYYHPLVGHFGAGGAGSEEKFYFNGPGRVAVDQGSHDVYVTAASRKAGTPNFYRFTASGEPDPFTAGPGAGTNKMVLHSGVAVAPPGAPGGTAGDFYAIIEGKVEVYSSEGAQLGTIDGSGNPNPGGRQAASVTTDSAGDLYIGYQRESPEFPYWHIDKYVPTANPPLNSDFDSELRFQQDAETGCELSDVAFAPGAFYAISNSQNCGSNAVFRARYPLAFPGGGGSALASPESSVTIGSYFRFLATNSSNGDLYTAIDRSYQEGTGLVLPKGIDQYDAAGNLLSFTVTPNVVEGDVDIDATSGQLYVPISAEEEKDVRIYGDGEPVEPPTATIDPVTTFDFRSAHFSGTVNPGGSGKLQETAYRFECKPKCPGLQGERTIPGDGADHAVSDDAVELQPETKYEVTLIARNTTISKAVTAAEVRSTTSFETPAKPVAIAPEVTIAPVTECGAERAHLSGTVDPKGTGKLQETTYRFEYSSNGLIWASAPEQGPIEGEGPQEVSTDIEGLEPNTAYQFRLHAKNVGGEATSAMPYPTCTTEAVAPLVEATDATHVLSASAQLNGRIDPRNSHTTYYFQWGSGDCASSPCASVPASQDADAGSGPAFVYVNAQLSGLSPATTYHYRLIAVSAAGEAPSQDATFSTEASAPCANARSGFSAALPDCRAYELVSPVNKRGADVTGWPSRTRSSTDGEAVSYGAVTSFGDSAGSTTSGVDYMSVRGPDGWSTHPLTPFQTPVPEPSGFSSSQYTGESSGDLEEGIFRGLTPVPGTGGSNVAGVANLYLASGMRSGTPHFQLLSDAAAPVPAVSEETTPHINFGGASADFKHVVFETHDNLTPDASGDGDKAYEWSEGEERLVGILPDDACEAPPCVAPESAIGAGALVGDITYGAGTYTNLAHAISEDGSRIFFTAGSLKLWGSLGGESWGFAGSLYVRINGQSTVQIDASERSTPDPNGSGRSHFLMATPDGKTALFLSREELVNADTDGSGTSLYRYEADAPAGEHLSLVDTAGVPVQHIIAMTPDMGYMYFIGGPGNGSDLYVKHGSDIHRFAAPGNDLGQSGSNMDGDQASEARMSADGRRLLFASIRDQGLYAPYVGVNEIYLYDYPSDELVCASCSENGTIPTSNASITTFAGQSLQVIDQGGPTAVPGIYNNTPLSSNGRYVFFSTRDSLVAGDTNGHLDAYSYDVESGKLHLISTGQCNCDSLFLTASPNGRDVFFSTHQQLVRADVDNLADIYDARIGGGIAAQNALPPAECQGDACQAAPSPPNDATPASSTFSGAGNLAPARKKAHKHHRKRHSKHAHRRSHGRKTNSRRRAGK